MRIFITRHGESMTNIDADITAKFPINVKNNVLTRQGVDQAVDYGLWLIENKHDLHNIVCSPYARTKQTAFLIASTIQTLVPIHYDRTFREIDWKINGRWHRDLDAQYPDLNVKTMPIDMKPVIDRKRKAHTLESPREVYDRVVPRFKHVVERYRGAGDLLIVTHFFVVRALQAYVEHGDPERLLDYNPNNLARVVYDIDQVADRFAQDDA